MTDTQTTPVLETITLHPAVLPAIPRNKAAQSLDLINQLLAGYNDVEIGVERRVSAHETLVAISAAMKLVGIQPLERCYGAAHRVGEGEANGHQDHCSLCLKFGRFGWLGPKVKVR